MAGSCKFRIIAPSKGFLHYCSFASSENRFKFQSLDKFKLTNLFCKKYLLYCSTISVTTKVYTESLKSLLITRM